MKPDPNYDFVVRQAALPEGQSGILLSVTPEEAGWQTLGFTVRRLAPGEMWKETTGRHEAAIVVLGGKMSIDWGEGPQSVGERENVFSGYSYSVYLPRGSQYEVRAETLLEFAETRVHSDAKFKPHLFTPSETGDEIRGGGDTTRQIVRIIRPEFAADKLMMNEVYTPAGNWSTYPPHKHDTNNLPAECDLDEIYYFRVDHPDGFAFLRVYDSAGNRDVTATVRDGDVGLLRDGYHLVAAAPGYSVYYLAVLAGAARSLANTTDPRYDRLRNAWPSPDPRVPLLKRE
jgi:5-deoxy-glucuronate isomerase